MKLYCGTIREHGYEDAEHDTDILIMGERTMRGAAKVLEQVAKRWRNPDMPPEVRGPYRTSKKKFVAEFLNSHTFSRR
jgi:hypothetical protein